MIIRRIFSCVLSVSVLVPTVSSSQVVYSGSPPIFLGISLDLLWSLWDQLRLWYGPTPACTCFQNSQLPPKSAASNVGTLVVYSDIPQIQGLASQQRGFNTVLLWLQEQISFLFSTPTALGDQLWFWPHLCLYAALRHLFPIERVTGRKARGSQVEEIDCNCQTCFFFLKWQEETNCQTCLFFVCLFVCFPFSIQLKGDFF